MFEYGNVTVESEADEVSSYSLTSYRFGLNLRLMAPARSIRFVGILGGGLVHDSLEYDIDPATQPSPCNVLK